GGGVQKMRVKMADVVWQLGSHHQRLAKATNPVRRQISTQVGEPCRPRRLIAAIPPATQPATPNPDRLLIKIFRQIQNGSVYEIVDGVSGSVRRMAQGNDQNLKPMALKSEDLLSNKGLRKPRIAFEDERSATRISGAHRQARFRSELAPQSSPL